MSDFKLYHVRGHNVGMTLAQMLKKILANKSWQEIRQLVIARKVEVSGNLCTDETRRLKANEIVRIHAESLAKPPDEMRLVIRYQDEHLLVVEKPASVTTLRHREEAHWDEKRKNRQPTLEEMLQKLISQHGVSRMPGRGAGHPLQKSRKQLNNKINRGKMQLKVRPVHRLDRETSGLMIFALSPAAEQKLTQMFSKHKIDRAYLAVVHGTIDKPRTIETKFTRDRGDGLRGSLPQGKDAEDAKVAITHFKPVGPVGTDYTMIECKLETGRTHQIRIHLSEIGHMLAGEEVYTRPLGGEVRKDESGAPRHALHAYKLAFLHPIIDQQMTFEQKMPTDLRKWISRIEKIAEEQAKAQKENRE